MRPAAPAAAALRAPLHTSAPPASKVAVSRLADPQPATFGSTCPAHRVRQSRVRWLLVATKSCYKSRRSTRPGRVGRWAEHSGGPLGPARLVVPWVSTSHSSRRPAGRDRPTACGGLCRWAASPASSRRLVRPHQRQVLGSTIRLQPPGPAHRTTRTVRDASSSTVPPFLRFNCSYASTATCLSTAQAPLEVLANGSLLWR